MITWLKQLFSRKHPTFRFLAVESNASVATPVSTARTTKANWLKKQAHGPKDKKFHNCPGMFDYYNAGYIIRAHCDIHIKANGSAVAIRYEGMQLDHGVSPHHYQFTPFDYDMVAGMCKLENVKPYAAKVPLPWSIQAKPGYSGYLVPALMHSDFLDKLFVYPGIVDYDNFHTINFVFTPIKECEFVIPAGTPLLQLLPFKREDVTAMCDRATQAEYDKHRFNFPSRFKQYYRRVLQGRKSYSLECPYKPRE